MIKKLLKYLKKPKTFLQIMRYVNYDESILNNFSKIVVKHNIESYYELGQYGYEQKYVKR